MSSHAPFLRQRSLTYANSTHVHLPDSLTTSIWEDFILWYIPFTSKIPLDLVISYFHDDFHDLHDRDLCVTPSHPISNPSLTLSTYALFLIISSLLYSLLTPSHPCTHFVIWPRCSLAITATYYYCFIRPRQLLLSRGFIFVHPITHCSSLYLYHLASSMCC